MPSLTLGLDGVFAVCSVFLCIIFLVGSARVWILRGRHFSLAVRLTEIGFYVTLLCCFTNIGLLITQLVEERTIRSRVGNDEAVAAEFNKPVFIIRGLVSWMLYILGLWALKLAYLGYYFELRTYLSKLNQTLYILTCIYTVAGFLICYGVLLGICWPVSRNWAPVQEKPCTVTLSIRFNALFSAMNISSDILILFFGVHIILNLRLNRPQRFGMILTTTVGLAAIVMAVLRFVLFYSSTTSQDNGLAKLHLLESINVLEASFAFVAFCLPPLQKLSFLQRCFNRSHGENDGNWDKVALRTIGGSGGSEKSRAIHIETPSGHRGSTIELTRASSV